MISVAGVVAIVERRVINSSSARVINSGDSDDDGEAADGNGDCCVVDVRPVVGLDRKYLRMCEDPSSVEFSPSAPLS